MKKNYRSSAVLLSLAFAATLASIPAAIGTVATYAQEVHQDAQDAQEAQAPQNPGPDGQQGRPHHGPNPELETKMLTRRLGLTADQAAKVEPILAAQDEQMKALRPQPGASTQPDFKAMHTQRKAIEDQTKEQLSGILTADQLTQFEKMHNHRGPGGPHGNYQNKGNSGGNQDSEL